MYRYCGNSLTRTPRQCTIIYTYRESEICHFFRNLRYIHHSEKILEYDFTFTVGVNRDMVEFLTLTQNFLPETINGMELYQADFLPITNYLEHSSYRSFRLYKIKTSLKRNEKSYNFTSTQFSMSTYDVLQSHFIPAKYIFFFFLDLDL